MSLQSTVYSLRLFIHRSPITGYRLLFLLSVVCGLLSMNGCKVYSFTGASITAKTVTVNPFGNQSENGNTAINQTLTDLLKNKFLTETNLNLVNSGGEVEFSGVITSYTIKGQAPTADQTTAINRLTISAKVEYFNRLDEKQSWTQTFTRFSDYESDQNLADVETQLMTDINTLIAEDIFNKAFVNW